MKTAAACVALCLFAGLGRADDPAPDAKALPVGALRRLGSEYLRHAEAKAALNTPDGRLWISAGGKDIRFWDTKTRRLVRTIDTYTDKDRSGVYKLRISGDGKSLAALTGIPFVVVYDIATGKERFRVKSPGVPFSASAFDISHDGRTVVTGTWDNEMTVWDTITKKEVRTIEGDRRLLREMQATGKALPGIEQPAGVVTLSPDGKWLAVVAMYDHNLRVYDLATGKEKHAFATHNPSYCSWAVFSPDSALVAMSRFPGPDLGGNAGLITVWDLATGKAVQDFAEPALAGFAVSPDWKLMAADDMQGEIHVWERETGKRRCVIPSSPFIGITALAFSHDSAALIGSYGFTTEMWDTKTGRALLGPEGHTGAIRAVDISRDASVIASGGADGAVFLWDGATGKVRHRFFEPRTEVTSVILSPDGSKVAASYRSSAGVFVWDVATGKEIKHILTDGLHNPSHVRFSHDGRTLAVSTLGDVKYQFFDTKTWKEQRHFAWWRGEGFAIGPVPFRFSPDGVRFAGVSAREPSEFVIGLWDMRREEPKLIGPVAHHIRDVAFSADGEYLAWSELNGVHVWDVRANRLLKTIRDAQVDVVNFTPDGRYLVVGKDLLPLEDKHPPLELPFEPGCLACSTDGRIIAASDECTMLVLDAKKLAKGGKR